MSPVVASLLSRSPASDWKRALKRNRSCVSEREWNLRVHEAGRITCGHDLSWVQIFCDGVNMFDYIGLAVEMPVSGSVAKA